MVYHNHDRVETPRGGVISDQIYGEKGKGHHGSGGNRDKGWGHKMSIRFHLLTKGMLRLYSKDIGSEGLRPQLVHCAPFPSIAPYFRILYLSYPKIRMAIVVYPKVRTTIVWYLDIETSIVFLSEDKD